MTQPGTAGPLARWFAGVSLAVLAAVVPRGPATAQAINEVPLTAETPLAGFNRLTVSVTLCQPGTTRCATIDHVMVDTGSVGLRLQAGAVPASLGLPAVRDADGQAVAECLRFIGNAAWGAVHRADVRLGGLVARDIPVQVVGDALPVAPGCPDAGHPTSNGTLGVGVRPTDCDGACVQSVSHPAYFTCAGRTCQPIAGSVPEPLRLPNPVARFAMHANGVMFDLPMPAHRGVPAVRGRLVFGIGTSPGNGLSTTSVVRLNPAGRFTTRYAGTDYPDSYIDSGTEYTSVPDPGLPRCRPGGTAVCLEPTREFSAELTGADGARLTLPFLVGRFPGNERGVFAAAASVAPPGSRAFVWGAPFFLGRRVYLMFRDQSVPGRPDLAGPFYAVGREAGR